MDQNITYAVCHNCLTAPGCCGATRYGWITCMWTLDWVMTDLSMRNTTFGV